MARRGEKLRDEILQTAKLVFLENGFERASMDEVARRASTSKRSLYAHFESKEKLFLAVIELVRGLFLARLNEPATYSNKPADALTSYCGRYVESMIYEPAVQLLRITMAEAARFPEAAAKHYDVMFTEVSNRLAAYFRATFGTAPRASREAAEQLIAQLLFPRLARALLGLETLVPALDERTLSPVVDLRAVRKTVTAVVDALARRD